MTVLFAFLVVGLLGALLGIGLGFASKALAVKKDERLEELESVLPGLNCGACGYAGCASYAEAVGAEEAPLTLCSPGGPETASELGRIMGVEVDVSSGKQVAQVHCRGGRDVSEYAFEYDGLEDCNALYLLYGGDKICKTSCLGLGSCIRVCPVDAIDYDNEGKVWVDKDVCISCGKCIEICPTAVMKWVPYEADYIVACNNRDPAKVVRKHCKVGCIACRICEKKSPEGGFVVENNLSTINFDATGDRREAAAKCPPKCIIPVTRLPAEVDEEAAAELSKKKEPERTGPGPSVAVAEPPEKPQKDETASGSHSDSDPATPSRRDSAGGDGGSATDQEAGDREGNAEARLIFGSTNTVPVGSSDESTEAFYQGSVKPYLRTLYTADRVPVVLHFSGHLLSWIDRHHSEYTDVLLEMVRRRQVELLGGGFYDPVLAMIPRPDRIGQIESLTTLLRKRFGRRPRGLWITESVWESSLPATLASCGIDYAFLDDYHFITGGFTGEEICRPCITEDQGKMVVVFPVCSELVLAARNGQPEDVISFLRSHMTDDPSVIFALIQDGEHYRDGSGRPKKDEARIGWLEQLIALIQENEEWLEVVLPHDYMRTPQPRPRAYFQSAASDEIMYGDLTPDRQSAYETLRRRFSESRDENIFGGRFRQFLTRYGESNLMYAKMQYTHVLVNQIRGDKYRRQAAREELWSGQSHAAYWHGRHGGIYDNSLRKHVFRSLIEAEKITRERGVFIPSVITVDFDMDGIDEYLYQGQSLNAYIHRQGGQMIEFDVLRASWNYLDTMSRRPETYHPASAARSGYDRQMRKSYLDRILEPSVTPEQFQRCDYHDLCLFPESFYEQEEYTRDGRRLTLRGDSPVRLPGAEPGEDLTELVLRKRYVFRKTAVKVDYTIVNAGGGKVEAVFCPEMNLGFLSQEADALRIFVGSARGSGTEISPELSTQPGGRPVRFHDLVNDVRLAVVPEASDETWIMPVETVSMGPGGLETRYQGTCVVPRWAVKLEPGDEFSGSLALNLE